MGIFQGRKSKNTIFVFRKSPRRHPWAIPDGNRRTTIRADGIARRRFHLTFANRLLNKFRPGYPDHLHWLGMGDSVDESALSGRPRGSVLLSRSACTLKSSPKHWENKTPRCSFGTVHGNKKLRARRGAVGKAAVVGIRERDTGIVKASMVSGTAKEMFHSMVADNVETGSTVYSDEDQGYVGLNSIGYLHSSVNYSVKEFVNEMTHPNGIEGVWAVLERE